MDKKELVCIYQEYNRYFVPTLYNIIDTENNYLKLEALPTIYKFNGESEEYHRDSYIEYIGRELVEDNTFVKYVASEQNIANWNTTGDIEFRKPKEELIIRSAFQREEDEVAWYIKTPYRLFSSNKAKTGYLLYVLEMLVEFKINVGKVYEYYSWIDKDAFKEKLKSKTSRLVDIRKYVNEEANEKLDLDNLHLTFNRNAMYKSKEREIGEIWITKEDAKKYNIKYIK